MSFQNGEQLLQDLSATNLNELVIEKPPIGDQGNKKIKSDNCKELQNIAILDIPHLLFDINARSFLLRKDDKHVSTVKSLPLDKKLKVKTIKIHENGA